MQNLGGRCPLPPVVGWQLGSPFSERGARAGGATGGLLGRSVIVIVGNPRLRFPPIPLLPGSRSGLRANAQGHRWLRVLYSSQVSARCGMGRRSRVAFGGGGQGPALKIPCLSSWVVGWIPVLALRGSAGSYTAFGCRGGWGGARSWGRRGARYSCAVPPEFPI